MPAGAPTELRVRVHPRARRVRTAWDGATLDVWVHAPPVEGQANDAVIRAVAEWLGVAPSRLRMARGMAARVKTLEVDPPVELPPAGG